MQTQSGRSGTTTNSIGWSQGLLCAPALTPLHPLPPTAPAWYSLHMNSNPFSFQRGVIEGFYGDPWGWDVRREYAPLLRAMGYHFYLYAPKGDRFLRRRWPEMWPPETLAQLRATAGAVRAAGIGFGIGLSPYELPQHYTPETRRRLCEKVSAIAEELRPDILGLLFDDMKGDFSELANIQVDIAHAARAHAPEARLIVCPSYYSCDPLLEKLFGKMPSGYLEILGAKLDRTIDVFWTGPMICSTEYPRAHLEWVSALLQRKPFLWDNYPVNDDRKMAPFIHLRPFQNRGPELAELTAGHAVNPMRQPWLSLVPLATLEANYRDGAAYDRSMALKTALSRHCTPPLASLLEQDIELLQDVGREALTETQRVHLRSRYEGYRGDRHADEILKWLHGDYQFSDTWYLD